MQLLNGEIKEISERSSGFAVINAEVGLSVLKTNPSVNIIMMKPATTKNPILVNSLFTKLVYYILKIS